VYAHEQRDYYNFWQHLENEYPRGNILMVTVTNDEAGCIEQQLDHETKVEIMGVFRKMFGNHIPKMEAILIPRWGRDRFFNGTYSNRPIGVSTHDFDNMKAPIGPIYVIGVLIELDIVVTLKKFMDLLAEHPMLKM
jgi:polyamine oxidase